MAEIQFKGCTLKAANSGTPLTCGTIIDTNGFGTASKKIDISTAGSTVDESRPGLPDLGEATINLFLSLDDTFQIYMESMRTNQTTDTFTIKNSSGTLNTQTFTAWVLDGMITGKVNDVYKYQLKLQLTSTIVSSTT